MKSIDRIIICAVTIVIILHNHAKAQTAITSGVSQAQLNAVAATIPIATNSAPTVPTGTGSIGTPGTYTPPDAAQKLVVQRTTVNTDSSGNWSVTFNPGFQSSAPTINAIPLNNSSNPMICNVATRSQTTQTGKCWQVTSQTV